MEKVKRLLAVDLGAESGRTVLGTLDGERLGIEQIRRFPNRPVDAAGTLYWDLPRLYADVLDGISAAGPVDSIGVDTWGLDFGLLDRTGRLLGNPVHYRDRRTEGMVDEVLRRVGREEIYERTGIQFMPINTLYQLMALVIWHDPQLDSANRLLTMPALLGYWLTGRQADEFTDATTTQCYDPRQHAWATDMLDKAGIPSWIFGDVVEPGTVLGTPRVELGLAASKVIAPGTHDTASAVAAVPFEGNQHSAYISSGTWSLVGVEVRKPLINREALEANLTNEGGVGGTFRLLKNVMGLWLLQECRRAWAAKGADMPYEVLLQLAEAAPPFSAVIDPDDERLLRRGDMPARIVELAVQGGYQLGREPGEIARCVLESLALKYRRTIEQIERVSGMHIRVVHVVGGGSSNRLLCQMTADASGRVVVAGPVEATAIGNILVQAMALGLVSTLEQARELVKRSVALETYEPKSTHEWNVVGHLAQRSSE